MNALEKGLRRGIPLEKAASFFYDLKHKGRVMTSEEDALMSEAVKQAASELEPEKTAAQRFDDLVLSFKKTAGDDGMPASSDSLPSPTPAKGQAPEDYLATEQMAQEEEDAVSLQFYQQKLEEARAQTAQNEQEKAELQQQVEQLTQQQESHDQQLAASQQEIQIAGQAAVQQVNQANTMASQAMQSAVEASNQALQAKATETTAKIQGQQLRTQLFDLASTGLPGTEPELGGAGNPAEGLEPTGDVPPPGGAEGGVEGEEDPAAAGAEGGPDAGGQESQAGGDAGADGSAGAPTAAMNTEGEPATEDGTTGADGAMGAAAAPGAVPPGGGGSDAPPQANASSGAGSQAGGPVPAAKPGGQVSIKVGFDTSRALQSLRDRKAPTAEQLAKCAAALPSYLRDPKIIGALAGGITGAGAAGLEATGHGPDLDQLQGKIDQGEQASREPGMRGFAQAFELAKDKALHTLGTATKNHPVAATLTGGLLGAGVGYGAGPEVGKLVGEAVQSHKG